ncbi:aminotransferase class III-fold pyridoxal phosphate-dependent enzyme [Halomonas sp. M20]|uniref:aminotransferase class III-fold pyridoxal phosphate-dependent enzyme n=1 Tax=Halomonas sp. M20 TaxID=2763264 RepID=UPI001D0A77CB|nr:aminotransferase class III-fold pyridoxal phosphate-dependent enzyme [Halomonas sp. M20]
MPSSPQAITIAQAIERAYGFTGTLERLDGYADLNFRLTLADGESLIAKLSQATGTLAEAELMAALETHDLGGIEIPRHRRDREGRLSVPISLDGETWRLRLMSLIPGSLWAESMAPSEAQLFTTGECLARLDLALQDMHWPQGPCHDWDLSQYKRLPARPEANALEPGMREMMTTCIEFVMAREEALPTQLIHNDANDYNLFLKAPDSEYPSGLIDFGDACLAFTVNELAVAAVYLTDRCPDRLEALEQLTLGYHSVRPLTAVELECLPRLILLRILLSRLNYLKAVDEGRDDPYVAISQEQVLTQWHAFATLTPEVMAQALDAACLAEDDSLTPGQDGSYAGRNSIGTLLQARRQMLSPTLSHAYRHPLKILRGDMAYLIAEDGRRYLDLVNNVCHVGHANPRVVEAGARQMAELNTNTRYLHDTIVAYSERLLATLPDHLEVVFLVNSGSEANDLALRLARQYTRRHDVAVIDHAYHGHLSSMIDISPYKHDGPGGQGTPDHVIKLPFPDNYRGCYRGDTAAERYLEDALATLDAAREPPAAFFAESFAGVGGQWVWPSRYIEGITQTLRERGTVYIADEVQVGFGRAGSSFWAFEQYAVTPDIVTLGKPMGNGHPIAGVVTTRAIANAFCTGMEYFNTFAGNPVSCAIGLAVLEEIEAGGLQVHAATLGTELKARLEALASNFARVGQVRGQGLFIGVEIIDGPSTLAPDKATAKRICHYLRLNGVLLSTDGPDDNVLKIKPPLAIQREDVDNFLTKLEASFDLYCH